MKKFYLWLYFVFCNIAYWSQTAFLSSLGCHVNINHGTWADPRFDIKNSTFRMRINQIGKNPGFFTGVLIDRDVSNGSQNDFFLTARHCVIDMDGTKTHTLAFNFQSPDDITGNTALSNRGNPIQQSTRADPTGYEYFHQSQIQVIAWYWWGDFALCKIVTPLPPHFNVFYAGWSTIDFKLGLNGAPGSTHACQNRDYVSIHHPSLDIKKISGTDQFYNKTNPLATSCYAVTTVVQILFGWIWQNSVIVSQVCNYVDNPWLTVPYWCDGTIEDGSSGCGFFNSNNRVIGVLSGGGVITCSGTDISTFAKFRNFYSASAVRNVLNPTHNIGIDLFGMPGRRVVCHSDLSLPGDPGVSGEYWPSKHYYAPHETIHLMATNDVVNNAPIRIYSGGVYEFSAGNNVIIDKNIEFEVENGAEFIVRRDGCHTTNLSSRQSSPAAQFREKISSVDLPQNKQWKSDPRLLRKTVEGQLRPNPNNGIFIIDGVNIEGAVNVSVRDMTAKELYKGTFQVRDNTIKIDLVNLSIPQGLYQVQISNENSAVKTFKLVIN